MNSVMRAKVKMLALFVLVIALVVMCTSIANADEQETYYVTPLQIKLYESYQQTAERLDGEDDPEKTDAELERMAVGLLQCSGFRTYQSKTSLPDQKLALFRAKQAERLLDHHQLLALYIIERGDKDAIPQKDFLQGLVHQLISVVNQFETAFADGKNPNELEQWQYHCDEQSSKVAARDYFAEKKLESEVQ